MIHIRYSNALMVLLVAAGIMWVSASAHAEEVAACTGYVGLTNRIAGCVRDAIDNGAAQFFAEIYPWLRGMISGVMTLAVILYGVLLSYGMVEKVGRDTMILIFKLASVIAFTASSPLLYSSAIGMMDAASSAVVSYAPPSGPADNAGTNFSQNTCLQNMVEQQASNGAGKAPAGPWLGIDCLLDTVIGIKTTNLNAPASTVKWFNEKFDSADPSQGNEGMARSYLYIFFSGVQTSIMGLIFAVVGFIFIYGLLMLVVNAFFTYIAGYIGVALMVIVSPIFIPLILFKTTKQYFDKWLKVTFSFALQPVIMLAFVVFSLSAIDFAAFSGNYSIMYRIAGEQTRAAKFDMNRYLSMPRDAQGKESATDLAAPIILKKSRDIAQFKGAVNEPLTAINKTEGVVTAFVSECSPEQIRLDNANNKAKRLEEKCGNYFPIKIAYDALDWKKMAKARVPAVVVPGKNAPTDEELGQQIAREVLASSVFCALVVFVMNGLLKIVPAMATDLLGDFGQSANIGGGSAANNPFSGMVTGMQSRLGKLVGRK